MYFYLILNSDRIVVQIKLMMLFLSFSILKSDIKMSNSLMKLLLLHLILISDKE